MRSLFIGVGLLLATSIAAAQVYRCGSTFSDKPCGSNAVKVQGTSAHEGSSGTAPATSGSGLPGYALACLNAIRATTNFPDKENLRVDDYAKAWETFEYADKKIVGLLVTLKVNPMGAYGSYTGARSFSCHMSEDGRRVLKVSAS